MIYHSKKEKISFKIFNTFKLENKKLKFGRGKVSQQCHNEKILPNLVKI